MQHRSQNSQNGCQVQHSLASAAAMLNMAARCVPHVMPDLWCTLHMAPTLAGPGSVLCMTLADTMCSMVLELLEQALHTMQSNWGSHHVQHDCTPDTAPHSAHSNHSRIHAALSASPRLTGASLRSGMLGKGKGEEDEAMGPIWPVDRPHDIHSAHGAKGV